MMDLPSAGIVPVSATYFDTLKIPIIRGRSFDRSDTPDSARGHHQYQSGQPVLEGAGRGESVCLRQQG